MSSFEKSGAKKRGLESYSSDKSGNYYESNSNEEDKYMKHQYRGESPIRKKHVKSSPEKTNQKIPLGTQSVLHSSLTKEKSLTTDLSSYSSDMEIRSLKHTETAISPEQSTSAYLRPTSKTKEGSLNNEALAENEDFPKHINKILPSKKRNAKFKTVSPISKCPKRKHYESNSFKDSIGCVVNENAPLATDISLNYPPDKECRYSNVDNDKPVSSINPVVQAKGVFSEEKQGCESYKSQEEICENNLSFNIHEKYKNNFKSLAEDKEHGDTCPMYGKSSNDIDILNSGDKRMFDRLSTNTNSEMPHPLIKNHRENCMEKYDDVKTTESKFIMPHEPSSAIAEFVIRHETEKLQNNNIHPSSLEQTTINNEIDYNKLSDNGNMCQNHLINNENKCTPIHDNSVTEYNVPSDIQNNEISKKQDSYNDTNSLKNDSQINEVNSNNEEEITEESRLIQMTPALREFDILDDLEESEHEEGEAQQSDSSEYESDAPKELPIEDVDAMLEEGLPDKFKDSAKSKEHNFKLKRKVVLEEIGYDHFDLLPEGWIQIMHSSGMPVYLHQKSRVCTMARPYYLGPGSSRNHKVPLSAIPCLQYKRALEVEKKNKEEHARNSEQNKNLSAIELMAARIETSEENEAAQSLEVFDLRDYCKKVFNFKTITLIPFRSWADRRRYVRMTKDLKRRQRPSLPGGTKLLKFPIRNADGTHNRSKGEWIINPNGKSYVCILHEYVQHALRKHPKYQFKELENPATPYSATVFIGDMEYSVGMGASKKQAKVEAAKSALEVLIPEMKDKIERDSQFGMRSGITRRPQNSDISIFDQIRVEDPRVAEFCAKTTEPPPYAILLTCLSRNMGLGDIKVHYEMNSKKHKEDEFTMTVGNHKATVVCKNKRDGKQRAAQAILQALHPNITHWGSLLRMYGNRSIKNVKEKKQEEQEITGLQSKAALNQPNFAILEKLRAEIIKLIDKRNGIKAKGKFIPPKNVILPSLSSTDLKKVNFS